MCKCPGLSAPPESQNKVNEFPRASGSLWEGCGCPEPRTGPGWKVPYPQHWAYLEKLCKKGGNLSKKKLKGAEQVMGLEPPGKWM